MQEAAISWAVLNNRRQKRVRPSTKHTHTHTLFICVVKAHTRAWRQCTFVSCFHYGLWRGMSQYPVCRSLSLFSDITSFFFTVCVFCVWVCYQLSSNYTKYTHTHAHNYTLSAAAAHFFLSQNLSFICKGSSNKISFWYKLKTRKKQKKDIEAVM